MTYEEHWRLYGITPEIEAAVRAYEKQHSPRPGLAVRVFHTISNCGGVDATRMLTKQRLMRVKNTGRKTIRAMVELGLCAAVLAGPGHVGKST